MTYKVRMVDASKESVLADLKKLHTICFPLDDEPPWDEGYWWLLFHEKEPVGFCGMMPSVQWKNTGYFTRSGVIPKHQGKRLQVRLIRARVALAKRLGWEALVTFTLDNPASANNLIRAGFTTYEPRSPWCGATTAIYWRKFFRR